LAIQTWNEGWQPRALAQHARRHFHTDNHQHYGNGTQPKYNGKAVAGNCCCGFCTSALAITPVVTLPAPELGAPRHFAPAQGPGTVGDGALFCAHEGEVIGWQAGRSQEAVPRRRNHNARKLRQAVLPAEHS
jgi:hypothetical protein